MKKILLAVAMFFRKFYSLIIECFVMCKIYREHTEAEIEQAKNAYLDFVASIGTLDDYADKIKGYKWTSDLMKGLIDWSPSKKNLWTFFLDKNHSRDCDDFAALAYYTLKDMGYGVTEYCVLINEKVNSAHMVVAVDDLYLLCNSTRYINAEGLEQTIRQLYKSGVYHKYR